MKNVVSVFGYCVVTFSVVLAYHTMGTDGLSFLGLAFRATFLRLKIGKLNVVVLIEGEVDVHPGRDDRNKNR